MLMHSKPRDPAFRDSNEDIAPQVAREYVYITCI